MDDLHKIFQATGSIVFVLVGVLYVIGLLIVNLDLVFYGLVSLSLARVEYVLAGATCARKKEKATGLRTPPTPARRQSARAVVYLDEHAVGAARRRPRPAPTPC
jgi:hypothetical protein